MNATARTLFVLLLGSGFAGTALAAMDSAQTTPDTQVPAHMSQKLHDDLTKAGFTDITAMPASLIVRAKDAQGNSVMMVINPISSNGWAEHTQGPAPHRKRFLAAPPGEPNSPIPAPTRSSNVGRSRRRLRPPVHCVSARCSNALANLRNAASNIELHQHAEVRL